MDKAVRDEAHHFANSVRKTITRTGGDKKWSKLSTLTIALRRGAAAAPAQLGMPSRGRKPLVRTGDLRRSVGVTKIKPSNYFSGVHRANPLVNLAAIHEEGVERIEVTDKMRRFFLFLYVKGVIDHPVPFKKGAVIILEQRSFMATTMERFKDGYGDRLMWRWGAYFWHNLRMPVKAM